MDKTMERAGEPPFLAVHDNPDNLALIRAWLKNSYRIKLARRPLP